MRFIHQPQNINVTFFDLLKKFPFIWTTITSLPFVRMLLDAYKDGYKDLVSQGIISESNLFDKRTGKMIESTIRKQIEETDYSDLHIDIDDALKFTNGIINGATDDGDSNDSTKEPIRNTIERMNQQYFNLKIDEDEATDLVSNGVAFIESLFK